MLSCVRLAGSAPTTSCLLVERVTVIHDSTTEREAICEMPLWLSSEDVISCLDERPLMMEMRNAFVQMSQSDTSNSRQPQRIKVGLSAVEGAPANASGMILAPGCVPGIFAYTVKVHAKYPDNPKTRMPAIQGVIHLFDSRNGKLLAIIDSPIVTAHRTAATAIVATDVLARPDSRSVAIIGAGVQGEIQLRYLRDIRDVSRIFVYDNDAEQARRYAERRTKEGVTCLVAESVQEAVAGVDMIIVSTWARSPLLYPDMIRPGTHITTLGADEPGKVEVAEELIRVGRFVCDDKVMAEQMGALNTFSKRHTIQIRTLGEVLINRNGRETVEDITIFSGVGLPTQDLVAAWHVYQRALTNGVGKRL